MKYSLIEIKRTWKPIKGQNKWCVVGSRKDNMSRENNPHIHHPLGFMYFHSHLGYMWALKKLKEGMINDRVEIIKRLTEEIQDISKLEIKCKKN